MVSTITTPLLLSIVIHAIVLQDHRVISTTSTSSLRLKIHTPPPLAFHLHKPSHTDNLHHAYRFRRHPFVPIHNNHVCYSFSKSSTSTTVVTTPEEIYENYANNERKVEVEEEEQRGKQRGFDDTSVGWDECMRRMATESLLPVFYLPRGCDDSSSNHEQRTTIPPEKAIKKLLRRYQKITLVTPSISFEERVATRKRLSHLILGTSVMRLWYHHLYTLLLREANDEREVEPFSSTVPNTNIGNNITIQQQPVTEFVSRVDTVRAIVDLHSKFTLPNSNNTIDFASYATATCSSAQEISIRRSIPLFLSKMISDQYGIQRADRIASSFNSPGPITLRRNAIKCASDTDLCERLWEDESAKLVRLSSLAIHHNNIILHPPPLVPEGCLRLLPQTDDARSIWSMPAWNDGWFEVQDAGSQSIVDAVDAKSGETIMDYCAGNGGKTFALASKMFADELDNPVGISSSSASLLSKTDLRTQPSCIIAHDIDPDRLKRLNGSFKRIGLADTNISIVTTFDTANLQEKSADAVLVDAPCSSSGALRRRPSHRFQMIEQEICEVFPPLQLEILVDAAKMVRVGGRLVYATCSILGNENEDVVDAFESLDEFRNWERWPFSAGVGDDDGGGSGVDNSTIGRPHCWALLPSVHDCDGFFVARWKRIE